MEAVDQPVEKDADLDLEARVLRAIRDVDILRPMRAEVNTSVREGQVTLTGLVPSPMAVTEVVRAVRAVPGVRQVDCRLLDDGSLGRQAAAALAADPRTRGIAPGYQVTCAFGQVSVIGQFSATQAGLLAQVAGSLEGVRSVRAVLL